MTAIALIGGDGSGKTTLAHRLVVALGGRARYLYMGQNPDSSNVALPTTRLVHAIKVRRAVEHSHGALSETEARASLHRLENRNTPRGPVWMWLRLANRLAEEVVRQLVSWSYEMRGVVIHDRHFIFDVSEAADGPVPERVHRWVLHHLYPRPDLVILLDAPGAVLWPRTREVPAEQLDALREVYLRRAALVKEFRVVSVDRDMDEVYADVHQQVTEFLDRARGGPGPNRGRRKR